MEAASCVRRGVWRLDERRDYLANSAATVTTDINGDGLHDFAYSQSNTWRYRKHPGATPDLLTRVTDGYGNTIDVTNRR